MFLYDTRSTKFMNLELSERGHTLNSFGGPAEGKEVILDVAIRVKSETKMITRTRRKFWDDVSIRGGQYSAAMILLTALYTLFQSPF